MGERTKATLAVVMFFMLLFAARTTARHFLSQPVPRAPEVPVEVAAEVETPPPVRIVTVDCGARSCGPLACDDQPCSGNACACASSGPSTLLGVGGETAGWTGLAAVGATTATLAPGTGTLSLSMPSSGAALVVLPLASAETSAAAGVWTGLSPGRYGIVGGEEFGWIGPIELAEGQSLTLALPPRGGAPTRITGPAGFTATPVGEKWGGKGVVIGKDGAVTVSIPSGAVVWIADGDGHGCIATPSGGTASCEAADAAPALPWTPTRAPANP